MAKKKLAGTWFDEGKRIKWYCDGSHGGIRFTIFRYPNHW